MALEQNGRVVLKIYSANGALLIARPCQSQEEAEKWYLDWLGGLQGGMKPQPDTTHVITAMVPRI